MLQQRMAEPMRTKRIAVSQKRQITIPVDFFNAIGIGAELECYVRNNTLVLRPVREESGAFDEEILADLIAQGFSGNDLLAKFKEARRQLRPAVERLLDEAARAAAGQAPCSTFRDVFGAEDGA